ncbi:MAG: HD domain-containing phosphohydrolase [Candidatus Omnitrophota bacterium]
MKDSVNILVIDDEVSILDSFSQLFTQEGYKIVRAKSWFEAAQLLTMQSFNIVIADVRLPDIGYKQMLEKIREENKYSFIISTAGFSDIEIAMESVSQGANDYFSKPFDPSDIKITIRKIIEKQRLHADNVQLFDTIKILALALDARDHYTHGHSEQVTEYAVSIAQEMGLSVQEIDRIRDAGILHDIGKIGIPDAVLLKPGPLNDEEYALIKKHPSIGRKILEPVNCLADKVPLIYHHHEHFDGQGYPEGLKAESIPVGARILAIADAYQAMTSDRPYRKALSIEVAVDELIKNKNKQFDGRIVDVFLNILKRTGKLDFLK